MAKYKHIADEIEQKIISGQYLLGAPLPDQVKLAQEYDTTRVTIQKAIKILVQKGLVYSRQGSGMYVKKNALISDHSMVGDSVKGTSKRLNDDRTISTKVIAFEVRFPTETECEYLMIKKEVPVYDTIRLRFADKEPFKLEYSLFPADLISGMTQATLEGSIYDYIRNQLHLNPSGVNRVIRAAKPNDKEKKYLSLKEEDPVLEVEQIVYLENGTPFEYSISKSPYDKTEFVINRSSFND
ncbi:GntR family transcriptional regulator [Enterococcus rivorum]|uniref:HTH gntR-type domain-containing protein n=1 Tax=Enterococcus rivorum TaxID=762845 RepID=A0A1E5KSC5_9ENTE|nr:GntR family transcriptional regulator [Enterococcus rivorum]MBP2097430.1 GntR family transcriptional regulator [Enterococcus rivorum]OEH80774.1 hypothetical protein BCR26_07165 [Enterococcus rivorum]